MNEELKQTKDGVWRGVFDAMAGPCEILLDVRERTDASRLFDDAVSETRRIERAFSRYRSDNVIHRINTSQGRPVTVDEETTGLLDFAAQCWSLSAGAFDVTSGVLRRVWTFDGSDRIPSQAAVEVLLPLIGWNHVRWERPVITLRPGMEIDLGGIAKEYAVDRVAGLLAGAGGAHVLVNFGGDLRAPGPRRGGGAWRVGVETPPGEAPGASAPAAAAPSIDLERGALATSGDVRRFLLRDGIRYSHVLDPRTGWPVADAPHSVTVLADTCVEAGLFSTLALLNGPRAETFLDAEGVRNWCRR
jgi:thiamine biosynthesis lipoprotein